MRFFGGPRKRKIPASAAAASNFVRHTTFKFKVDTYADDDDDNDEERVRRRRSAVTVAGGGGGGRGRRPWKRLKIANSPGTRGIRGVAPIVAN